MIRVGITGILLIILSVFSIGCPATLPIVGSVGTGLAVSNKIVNYSLTNRELNLREREVELKEKEFDLLYK